MQATSGSPGPFSEGDVALVTVSYRGDLDLARDLSRSVDTYLSDNIEHILVVPRSDVALFEPLRSSRRRIVAKEDVLPRGYVKLPAPRTLHVGPWRRHIREMWAADYTRLVRGWILQQVVKLSAPSFTDREIIVFADSDIMFVAPLPVDRLAEGDRVRLYRVPDAASDLVTHVRWHDVAARLLGLEPRGYLGADYIGHLTTWRRSTILLLQDRLATVSGQRWDRVVARQSHVSEYVLYGIFAEFVLGNEASGHRPTREDLVHASWFYDLGTDSGVQAFLSGFAEGQVAVAIQSTESFALEERRDLVRRIVDGSPHLEVPAD